MDHDIRSCFCCNNHYEVVSFLWSHLSDVPFNEVSKDDFIKVQRRANAIRIKSNFRVYSDDQQAIDLSAATFAKQVRQGVENLI